MGGLKIEGSLYYEVLMQPENANGADTLPHELQEWYYQHSEMSNIAS